MKEYTSTCDRCKNTETVEVSTTPKLKLHEVGVGWQQHTCYSNYTFIGLKQEWCQDCCIAVGLCAPENPNSIIHPPPTIEDMLREIIREEVQNATGAAS